jgi:sporulation protein YlmC with PRC-barrel domain
MNSKELIGKEVIDSEARYVGNVKDVEIDLKKWSVAGIIVKTGFLRKRIIQAADIDKVGDKVVLKVPADRIQRA